ncbi:DUF2591 family protein [Enterobacter hormaechei]|nr:DUF2591 family protein [Enterobacter hormaechei]ELC7460437.1 DUF2591 family protein [Enterobacter hormaechei]
MTASATALSTSLRSRRLLRRRVNRGWGAEAFHPNDAYSFNDNPLRAAMIVFLMMQESANVQDNPA